MAGVDRRRRVGVGIAAAFAVGWYLRRAGLATEDRLPPLHARARGGP